jgi:hypothetical protein
MEETQRQQISKEDTRAVNEGRKDELQQENDAPQSIGADATDKVKKQENLPSSSSAPAQTGASSPAKKAAKENQAEDVKKAEQPPLSVAGASDQQLQDEQKLFVVEEHHETTEVIERLLDVKGLEQSVTGLWGWMSGGVNKVAEQASKAAEKATQQASIVAEKASQQANIVAEKASQHAKIAAEKAVMAKEMATQQATELAATVSKTMEDKTSETLASKPPTVVLAAALPWESAHPERRAEARERVLKLSMDDHTFTIPPPKEASFVYDSAAREPYAARMLDTDALLSAKRFKLVPKTVDEQDFWRNYFYRVDLILNALGVPPPTTSKDEKSGKCDKPTAAADSAAVEATRNQDWEEEMRKEIAAAEASHVEDGVKEDENFDMLEDDLEFDDDGDLEKSINDLHL